MGAILAAQFPFPAAAAMLPDSAMVAPASVASEVHFDPASRAVHLGSRTSDGAVRVPVAITIARAADLAGQPLRQIITQPSRASNTLLNGRMPLGLPLHRSVLTSRFGLREHPLLGGWRAHNGVDLAAISGTPVAATSEGLVTAAGWGGGYGQFVSIDHGRGVETRYGHMSRLNVFAGQRVRPGDVIGFVGSTGQSTGPHLHYEIRVDGRPVNPLLPKRR